MRNTYNIKILIRSPYRRKCQGKAGTLEGKGGERPAKRSETCPAPDGVPMKLIGKALDAGTVKLVGTIKSLIIREVSALIREPKVYEAMAKANNPYGDGKACNRIIEALY